jgi:hypothetical protein
VWLGRHDTRALVDAVSAFRADLAAHAGELPGGPAPPKRVRSGGVGTAAADAGAPR